eukprot:Opistho-1_new@97521
MESTAPRWHVWDTLAQKRGLRHTVYSVNGDEYTGEWENNKKHGKGTQIWHSGAKYDGDWKDGRRHGFGTYSVKVGPDEYRKVYAGAWKNDLYHGYGTCYYQDGGTYNGEWHCGKRSGWGTMNYADKSQYEGEWFDDMRNGQGILTLVNENRYEGYWKDDRKNGPGRFFYLDKGQCYEGTWVDGTAKCGQFFDFERDMAPQPTQYALPKLTLQDPEHVLDEAAMVAMRRQRV